MSVELGAERRSRRAYSCITGTSPGIMIATGTAGYGPEQPCLLHRHGPQDGGGAVALIEASRLDGV